MHPAEAYILRQEAPFQEILLHLKTLIENIVPGVSLKYKYGIPFYYLKDSPFCYLNQSRDYVDLGLVHGGRLTLHRGQMETRGRKQVTSLRYYQTDEIQYDLLKEVLQEAMELQP